MTSSRTDQFPDEILFRYRAEMIAIQFVESLRRVKIIPRLLYISHSLAPSWRISFSSIRNPDCVAEIIRSSVIFLSLLSEIHIIGLRSLGFEKFVCVEGSARNVWNEAWPDCLCSSKFTRGSEKRARQSARPRKASDVQTQPCFFLALHDSRIAIKHKLSPEKFRPSGNFDPYM